MSLSRRLSLPAVLLALLISGPGTVEAQFRELGVARMHAPYDELSGGRVAGSLGITSAPGGEASMTRPIIGAALGLPLGLLTGAALGYAVGPRDDVASECMFACVASGPLAGGLIGTMVGAGVGAHLLNHGRGNGWLTVASSVLGALAGTGLGVLIGSSTDSEVIGAVVAIPLAVGLPAVVEWATTK